MRVIRVGQVCKERPNTTANGFHSHKYQQLPLIPVDQFLADHPEHAGADEVALTIARIDHEHAERLALEEQRQALLKKKQGLIADNKKRKEDLANLDKDLEKFIDVRYNILLSIVSMTDLRTRPPNPFRRPLNVDEISNSKYLTTYTCFVLSSYDDLRGIACFNAALAAGLWQTCPLSVSE